MPTPQPVTIDMFIDGAWTNVPAYSEHGLLEVTIGPDVETGTRASKLEGILNNDDLSMDPENVSGTYYGKIGRNTKVRTRLAGTTLTQAEMSRWEPDRSPEHVPGAKRGLSMTSFTAEGVLRRIGKWSDPIRSAVVRQVLSVDGLLGLFPMEDPNGAGAISNLVPNGQQAATSGTASYAGSDGPAGSDKVLKLGTDGQVTGVWNRPVSNAAGFQIGWSMKMDAVPASGTYEAAWRFSTSAGHIYTMFVNNISFDFRVTTADGTTLGTQNSTFGAGVTPTSWISYRIKVTDIGTQVQVEPAWYPQDGAVLYGITFAFTANTNGVLIDWAGMHADTAYGHAFATESTVVNLQTTASVSAFNGYLGERAGSRVARLCSEEGIGFYSLGSLNDTALMGRQRPDVFLDLIEECLRTDGALLYDEPTDAGAVTWVGRIYRQSQTTPALDLTYPAHIADYTRVTDDTGVANDVTADNADGQQVTVELLTGPLSVLPQPAGISRVRKKIDVNYQFATDLAQRAQFELSKSTINRPRYTSVTVDLLANPGLTAQVNALRPGVLVRITGLEPDPVLLHLLAITHRVGSITRTAVLSTLPAEVYGVGVYDAAGSLYDSASTTLASAVTSTATALPLSTADSRETWPTTGFPYPLKVSGERVNVTAMTAAAGSGPYTQTATVTRSVNGVVKAQLAGAEVHLADPARYA